MVSVMVRKNDEREHVVPDELGWAIKTRGETEYHFATKAGATEKARNMAKARGTALVIHGRDGRIQKKQDFR